MDASKDLMEYSDEQAAHEHRIPPSTPSSTNDLPRLNFDVLLEVMQRVPKRATLLRMMYTCRTLYEGGVRLLFAFDVEIGDRELHSFCLNIMADVSRCRHIRDLVLQPSPPPTYGWTDLEREALLALAHNALDLECLGVTESIFQQGPRYAEALGSLKKLKYLTIRGYDLPAAPFLSHLTSPLRYLDIKFSNEANFIEVIQPHHWSLSTLCVSYCKLPDNLEPVTVFSNITRLYLSNFFDADGPFLMKSFPNLRGLHYKVEPGTPAGIRHMPSLHSDEADLEELVDVREASIAEQLRSKCGWSSLDEVTGPILWVYAMGIICHIRNLKLKNEWYNDMHLAYYPDVIESTQPLDLYISTRTEDCLQYVYRVLEAIGTTVERLTVRTGLMDVTTLKQTLRDGRSPRGWKTSLTELLLIFEMDCPGNNPPRCYNQLAWEYANNFWDLESFEIDIRWSDKERSSILWEVEREDDNIELHETSKRMS